MFHLTNKYETILGGGNSSFSTLHEEKFSFSSHFIKMLLSVSRQMSKENREHPISLHHHLLMHYLQVFSQHLSHPLYHLPLNRCTDFTSFIPPA